MYVNWTLSLVLTSLAIIIYTSHKELATQSRFELTPATNDMSSRGSLHLIIELPTAGAKFCLERNPERSSKTNYLESVLGEELLLF